jgi:hypothetical protein
VYLALEAAAWAVLYVLVGALPDGRNAMLYSLNAITSYGHADIYLEDHWRLLGAIEAVNSLILFGLSKAFENRGCFRGDVRTFRFFSLLW